jgi:hypothetical protein
MPTRRLNQVLAIEKDIRQATMRKLTDAHHALQRPGMLEGIDKTYRPRDDDGVQLPPELGRVQATVTEMIEATREALVDLFDVTAARDFSNGPGDSGAVADVVVGDQVLIEKAPVAYLLWLERQLDNLHTFATKLPVHDPSTRWTLRDPRGVYQSEPVQTTRTEKQLRSIELSPATKEHKAQVHPYEEHVVVGFWTTVKLTGSIPIAERAALVQRIDRLRQAVHSARETANSVEAADPAPGTRLVSYIFG